MLLSTSIAHAQARLRHEYVDPSFLRNNQPLSGAGTEVEGGDPVPAAVSRDGARLAAPGADDSNTPTMDPIDGDAIPRPDEARPDRQTTQDQALTYHAVFNPTVAPMRRNISFDRIKADYRMVVTGSPNRRVPLAPRTPVAGREMFWGDVKLSLGQGPAPVPSVAPDMRVLAVRTEPDVPVQFSKDVADNFYVESTHRGPVRVVFLVDAATSYFSAPVPGNVPLDTQSDHPATQLPDGIRREAQGVLETIGVRPDMSFAAGLDALVIWFRGFESGQPSPAKASIFVDLALGRKGVCRHRAFAFTLAARAAGIPTRQVQNEAHAFVEVLAPDGLWRRIDLGGEAPSLDFKNGENHRLHQPPPDAFGKPESYASQYSAQLQGQGGDGAGDAQITDKPQPLNGPGGGSGSGSGAGGDPTLDAPMSDSGDAPPIEVALPEAGPAGPPTDAVTNQPLQPVSVQLDRTAGDFEAFRGEGLPFEVVGSVTAAGAGAKAVRVQVYLLPEGGGDPRPVGAAVSTDAQGRFTSKVRLPPTLMLGHYRLVVASKSTGEFEPGRSDR
ncbi:MAG: hypothetical protein ACI9U2_003486 [Bradymonadia bacterium]|jgi:hypothetical protein